MKEKIIKSGFTAIVLLVIILLFTILDHSIHGLEKAWRVPDYYFRNKIPFGFLWGVVGLLLVRKIPNIWLKALVVAGVISVTLQTRYFIEGYPLNFVLLFLLIHFFVLYFLSLVMFLVFNKTFNKENMKNLIIAIAVLAVVGIGTYYLVFNKSSSNQPANTSQTYTPPSQTNTETNTPVPNTAQTPETGGVTVNIKSFSFNPGTLAIKTGTKVTWTNDDSVPHTITSDSGSLLNSGTLSPGQSFSFTFTKAGSEAYHCSIHPMMKGNVTVTN